MAQIRQEIAGMIIWIMMGVFILLYKILRKSEGGGIYTVSDKIARIILFLLWATPVVIAAISKKYNLSSFTF